MKYMTYKFDENKQDYSNELVDLSQEQIKLFQAIEYFLKTKLVYRGVDKETYKNFESFIFIGGEKSRNNLQLEDESLLEYAVPKMFEVGVFERYNKLLDLFKNNFRNFSAYNITGDISVIPEEIENFRKKNKISYYKMYLKILAFLHIMQHQVTFENEKTLQAVIPYVSASRDRALAEERFAKDYIVVAFINDFLKDKYFETKNIKKFSEAIGIQGFEDLYKEVIFLDCIFPHNILGIIKKCNHSNETTFIVNPYSIEFFKNSCSFEDMLNKLNKDGIPINQENFYEKLKDQSFYKKYVVQLWNNQREIKNVNGGRN